MWVYWKANQAWPVCFQHSEPVPSDNKQLAREVREKTVESPVRTFFTFGTLSPLEGSCAYHMFGRKSTPPGLSCDPLPPPGLI
jgi:hypothetical protein